MNRAHFLYAVCAAFLFAAMLRAGPALALTDQLTNAAEGGAGIWYVRCSDAMQSDGSDPQKAINGIACIQYVNGVLDALVLVPNTPPFAKISAPRIVCPPAIGEESGVVIAHVLRWMGDNLSTVAPMTVRTAVVAALANVYVCK